MNEKEKRKQEQERNKKTFLEALAIAGKLGREWHMEKIVDDAKLGNKRTIKIKTSPKQKEIFRVFFDRSIDYLLIGGGANGGKTYGAVILMVLTCLSLPGIKWVMGRSNLKSGKLGAWSTLTKVLRETFGLNEGIKGPNNSVEKGHFANDKSDHCITFSNGSSIQLLAFGRKPGDENYDWLTGYEFTFCYIDEVQDGIEEKFLSEMMTRLRHEHARYGLKGKILMSCNPKNGWLKEMFYEPYRKGKEQEGKRFIPLLYTDNTALKEEDKKAYEKSILNTGNKITIERKLKGNWDYDDTEGKLFSYDTLKEMFEVSRALYNYETIRQADDTTKTIKTKIGDSASWEIEGYEIERNQKAPNFEDLEYGKCITVDPSGSGKDRCVILVWDGFDIIDSKVIEGATTMPEIAGEIRRLCHKHDIPLENTAIDGNGLGVGLVDELNQGQPEKNKVFSFIAQNAPIKIEGKSLNYLTLRDQCFYILQYYYNQIKVLDQGLIEDYKNDILQELDAISFIDADGTSDKKIRIIPKKELKIDLGRSPDFADNFSFRIGLHLKKLSESKRKKGYSYFETLTRSI